MSEKDLTHAEIILGETDEGIIEAEESDRQMQPDSLGRRRALLASLAAAPVILSLMNRSAWAQTTASCNLVNSFVNAGYRWQSPRPANNNGQLSFTAEEYKNCGREPPI
jgi:hypothetical protein